jgi:hypothetical protein
MLLLWLMMLADKPVGPYRDAELTVQTALASTQLVPCIARTLARAGNIVTLPIENGTAIDLQDKATILGMRGSPRLSIQVVEINERRQVSATYRHPFTKNGARQFIAEVGKKCFPDELAEQNPTK